MRGRPGFFNVDDRLQRLTDLGDQLLAFAKVVDFEMFRPELTKALAYLDGAQGGRPPFDPLMMFKVLVCKFASNNEPTPYRRQVPEIAAKLTHDPGVTVGRDAKR